MAEEKELEEFRKFCANQIMRLSSLPKFPFHPTGVNELVNFVEKRSGGDRDQVRRVIDAAVDYEQCPSIADLRRQWILLFDPAPPRGCPECLNHPGFRVVERNGITAAAPCQCRATPAHSETAAYAMEGSRS